MAISFKPMSEADLPLWYQWVTVSHVKNTWFLEGYETPDMVVHKIKGNGYDYPFMILADKKPIGFILCSDLYAYKTLADNVKGLFINELPGTFSVDLFIADADYLDKGYGTEAVKGFVDYIFKNFYSKRIMIDPAISNVRAIRCYEKAGFSKVEVKGDGVETCQTMAIEKSNDLKLEKVDQFLSKVILWAYQNPSISSIALVGSFAKGTAHEESDIDLIILTDEKQQYLEDTNWITEFGVPINKQIEDYGKCTSLRVWYQNGLEVEFGLALNDWAKIPVDSGTKEVVSGAVQLMVDKTGLMKNLLRALCVS